jgi:hypothetical protein
MKYPNLFNYLALLWLTVCSAGTLFGQSAPDTIISKNSVWKYLDNGTDQYGSFEDFDYDDSQWQEGPGRLGYGGDGETTVLSWGPVSNNKYVTYYFRKKITIDDPTAYKALLMNITRDDGIRVFVNGVEVIRDNLPAGNVTYLTYAPVNITGANETTYFPFFIPTASLVIGENIISVGLHNRDANSSDIGFDMEFLGFTEGASIQVVHNSADITLKEVSLFMVNSADTVLINSNFNYLQATSFFDVALESTKIVLCPAGYTQIADVLAEQTFEPAPGLKQTFFINGVALRPNDMKAEGKIEFARGSEWKYNDTGVDPGADWTTTSYNDASWQSGPTPMGYGRTAYVQGGTTISFGPSSTNKRIAYYFRRTFEVEDVNEIAGALANVWFDDGFVAYINGVEVFRANMPGGAITHTTRANATVGSTAATRNFSIPLNLLVNGTNTFAVTVRQDAPSSSDLTFDANLEFVFGKMLMPRGSVWKYLDDGSDQGTDWTLPGFDDSTWAAGPAELGYGDGDEATVVGFGPDAADKYPCTYFRSSFEVTDPSIIGSMRFLAVRDDGIVIYLNGVEVVRDNMPEGAITFKTYANGTVDGNNERIFFEYEVSPDLLVAGTNTLAVSIHQDRPSSSDISFNLEIIAKEKGTFWVNPNGVALGAQLTGNVVDLNNTEGIKGASFVNGVTDAPAYSLSVLGALPGENLVNNVIFKSSQAVSNLPANAVVLKLNTFNREWLYGVDLTGYEDSNVVFFTTGFYNLDKNEVDSTSIFATLAMVTKSGRVVLLQKPMTKVKFVHNSSDVNLQTATLLITTENNQEIEITANQFNFSDLIEVPAAENLTFSINGQSLASRLLTYNNEYLVILKGVDNSSGDYFENPETLMPVDLSLTFYNQTETDWLSGANNNELNVILFQGVTDAPFLEISNLDASQFLTEDIALGENTGWVNFENGFDYVVVKSNTEEEIHTVFTAEKPVNTNQNFILFTNGFFYPENNVAGANSVGIWGFNADGERIVWSQPTASIKVVHLATDITLKSVNLNVNGATHNISFREVSDAITVKAFVPQEVSTLGLNLNLKHNSLAYILVYVSETGLESMVITEEEWNVLPDFQVFNSLLTADVLNTTFFTSPRQELSFNSLAITESPASILANDVVIRTEFSATDHRFHVLPASSAKYLLVANGFAYGNPHAPFAWYVLTSEGDWFALADTTDITLSANQTLPVNTLVYPNPTNDKLFISTELAQYNIKITNLMGQVVAEESAQGNHAVSVNHLSKGVYVVSITDSATQTVYYQKVIVE